MRTTIAVILIAGLLAVALPACKTPSGDNPSQKRAAVQNMHDSTLAELYREVPAARGLVSNAPGYAVFSNLNTKIFLLGTGQGYGVVTDNRTGRRTYMRMTQLGVGVGAGVQDWRGVFIFNNPATLRQFVNSGWDFGGDAQAAAVTDDVGGGISRAVSVQGITIFTFTKHGLALSAQVSGTKYWLDDELN